MHTTAMQRAHKRFRAHIEISQLEIVRVKTLECREGQCRE
jgi:hypothetical protein